jgi:phosphatidate cytidylyltransferase
MDESSKKLITGACLGVLGLGLFFLPAWAFTVICLILLARILLREWPRLFKLQDPLFWMLMPLYPILPTCMMIYMQLHGYNMLNLALTTLVTVHDTGAYFIGRHIGKHLMSPTISPNKTWEGFIGGTVLSFLSSLIFFGHHPVLLIVGSVLPFVISINCAALAGDLFESLLKRRAGLKDAGTMLPGHGGILDRIDGLLFAVGIVFFVRNWALLLLQ